MTVQGFVTWTVEDSIRSAVLRGLLVERDGTESLVWPGWNEVPETIELGDGMLLRTVSAGRDGLIAEFVGDGDELVGLALEDALVDEGFVPFFGADQLSGWAGDWLEVSP